MDLHIAMLAILTIGIGWVMMTAGLQKNVLEWRQSKRVCPSCGHQIRARVCTHCVG